jgi:dihydroorotase
MSWMRAVEVMSTTPAAIAGYTHHGRKIAVGEPAHLAIVDPAAMWEVDRATLASKSKNTPFHGMKLSGSVVATFFNGHLTHKVGN